MKTSQTTMSFHECECGAEWIDVWDCACSDECPACGAEVEATEWWDINELRAILDEHDQRKLKARIGQETTQFGPRMDLAEALRDGATDDIWWDADTPEDRARIARVQKAMEDAADVLAAPIHADPTRARTEGDGSDTVRWVIVSHDDTSGEVTAWGLSWHTREAALRWAQQSVEGCEVPEPVRHDEYDDSYDHAAPYGWPEGFADWRQLWVCPVYPDAAVALRELQNQEATA